jgi:hypothetical protein
MGTLAVEEGSRNAGHFFAIFSALHAVKNTGYSSEILMLIFL